MALTFVPANQDRVDASAHNSINALSAGAIAIWFRSTNAVASPLCMYSEGNTGGTNKLLQINLNVTTAGAVHVIRRDNSLNLMEMSYSGSYNDGNWHLLVYSWSALNSHELIVDGTSRDTDATNLAGGLSMDIVNIGRRALGAATRDRYFDGDLSDIATFTTALNTTEATALYNKTEHMMSVKGEAGVISYWTLSPTAMPSRYVHDITNVALGAAIPNGTSGGPTAANGPDGSDKPTGMVATTDIANAYIFDNPTSVTLAAPDGTDDALLREHGNVVHDETDTGKEYKFYYSGSPSPYNGANSGILMAYSSDLATWTRHGFVIESSTLPSEDPYVVIDPATGTYHLWCENKTGGTNASGIAHFTSSDGISWTLENGTAFDDSASGWDSTDVSSPAVWVEGGTWYMLYEGRSTGTDGQTGLATASDPDGPWTRDAGNPVLPVGAGGSFYDEQMVAIDVNKIGSTYYVTASGYDGASWRGAVASSSNLTTWTVRTVPLMWGNGGAVPLLLRGTAFAKGVVFDDDGTDFVVQQWYGDAATQTDEWPEPYSEEPPAETYVPRSGLAMMSGVAMV